MILDAPRLPLLLKAAGRLIRGQGEAADVVLLNKMDLLPYFDFDVEYFRKGVEALNPGLAFFPLSAKTGEGIDELLEMISLMADLQELKANPDKKANGFIIESRLDKGRGPIATILVSSGTLKIGDYLVSGTNFCKVRAMIDHQGKKVKLAPPSTPVEVLGFDGVPEAGDVVIALENEKEAKELIEYRKNKEKEQAISQQRKISLEEFQQHIMEFQKMDL
jgi:translation initiation factor IF-2